MRRLRKLNVRTRLLVFCIANFHPDTTDAAEPLGLYQKMLVASVGGFVPQYQVTVDAPRLH